MCILLFVIGRCSHSSPHHPPRAPGIRLSMLGLIPVAVIAVFLTQHLSNYAGDIQHLDDMGGCKVVSP